VALLVGLVTACQAQPQGTSCVRYPETWRVRAKSPGNS